MLKEKWKNYEWEFRFGDDMSHTYGDAVKLTTSTLNSAQSPTIEDGSAHCQTSLWEGNSSSKTVNQSGNSTFTPNKVWIKDRNFGNIGNIFDSVRGSNKGLALDSGTEDTNSDGVTFGSGSIAFTGGGNTGDINESNRTYVGWQWLGGSANSTPSGGDISTTCSVNQTAGFSIVSWEGNNTNEQTIAHGLGATPDMLIYRKREGSQWFVQHAGCTGGVANGTSTKQLTLDGTDAEGGPFSGGYIDTVGSSTVRLKQGSSSMNNCNASGDNYIGYFFVEIPGYSKFGSYEGGVNSTDGKYVELGFRPSFLLFKNRDNQLSLYDLVFSHRVMFFYTFQNLRLIVIQICLLLLRS